MIAWFLAIMAPKFAWTQCIDYARTPDNLNKQRVMITDYRSFGNTIRSWIVEMPGSNTTPLLNDAPVASRTRGMLERLELPGAPFADPDERLLSSAHIGGWLHSAGWPFRAMWFANRHGNDRDIIGGLLFVTSNTVPAHPLEVRAVPLRIIWFGFLGNSLMFATGCIVSVQAITRIRSWIRRRRWRGEECGYSHIGLPASGPGPECGHGGSR